MIRGSPHQTPGKIGLSYRLLLLLYPREFREGFETDLRQAISDRLGALEGSALGRRRLMAKELWSLLWAAPATRASARRMGGTRVVRRAGAPRRRKPA